jgi:hypothetical protein
MVRRSLVAVVLFLSLVAGALATAQPAAATGSCNWWVVVNNSHGRLVVGACVQHLGGSAPGERTEGWYYCYKSGSSDSQNCNIGATQVLWYNATPMRTDGISGCCWAPVWGPGLGTPAGCTTGWIKTVIQDIRVRFSDGSLWSNTGKVYSPSVAGSSNLACLG